jgi:aminoglycoside phosphotransferase (APT) family kinase protein
MRDQLAAFLSGKHGQPVEVGEVRRINVGHSRCMLRLESSLGRLVVRVEQGGVFGTSSAEEYRVMGALWSVGVPVARVRWMEPTGEVLGQPFFVMDFLESAAAADERAADQATCASFVRALADLHALDPASLAATFDIQPTDGSDATHRQIDRWATVGRIGEERLPPLLDRAAEWLHEYVPQLDRLSVVHGDAGPGNFVHDAGRVVAITDWEFAHLGDPAEDWSFCVAMRGSRTMSADRWRSLFDEIAGVSLTAERWRYWEAFNLFKGACANRTCLDVFERGVNPAPNMAIIGTALHRVFLRRLVDIVAEPLVPTRRSTT